MSYKVSVKEMEESWGDGRSELLIEINGEVVAEHYDGGESEDNYFFRDWSWVKTELDRAYLQGRIDGIADIVPDLSKN